MVTRLVRIGVVVLLAGAGLALTRGDARRSHDLDSYTDAQLEEDLRAELDDLFEPDGELDPNKAYPVAELEEAILDALHDEGDDEEEDDVDFQDIVDEMSEAETTPDACIEEAVGLADEFSSAATPSRDGSESLFRYASLAQGRKRNGFATSRTAVDRSVRAIIVDVRKSRR
jgi:hypothetical protein